MTNKIAAIKNSVLPFVFIIKNELAVVTVDLRCFNKHLSGAGGIAGGRADNTTFLHHIHYLGCAAVTDAETALEQGGTGLALSNNQLHAACVELGIFIAHAIATESASVVSTGTGPIGIVHFCRNALHEVLLGMGGTELDDGRNFGVAYKGALGSCHLGNATRGQEEEVTFTQQVFCPVGIENHAAIQRAGWLL